MLQRKQLAPLISDLGWQVKRTDTKEILMNFLRDTYPNDTVASLIEKIYKKQSAQDRAKTPLMEFAKNYALKHNLWLYIVDTKLHPRSNIPTFGSALPLSPGFGDAPSSPRRAITPPRSMVPPRSPPRSMAPPPRSPPRSMVPLPQQGFSYGGQAPTIPWSQGQGQAFPSQPFAPSAYGVYPPAFGQAPILYTQAYPPALQRALAPPSQFGQPGQPLFGQAPAPVPYTQAHPPALQRALALPPQFYQSQFAQPGQPLFGNPQQR